MEAFKDIRSWLMPMLGQFSEETYEYTAVMAVSEKLSTVEVRVKELETRVQDAERAMGNAYVWPNDGDARTEHVKHCLGEYREKYPEVLKVTR